MRCRLLRSGAKAGASGRGTGCLAEGLRQGACHTNLLGFILVSPPVGSLAHLAQTVADVLVFLSVKQ